VRIISRSLLRAFWSRKGCEEAQQPLLAWFREVSRAEWKSPSEVKALYGSADVVGDGRIVFNIGGNKFRLVVWVKYSAGLVLIKWVGTHEAYDAIDVTKIGLPSPRASRPKKKAKES
jgi:mRNA interferase HigB